MRKSVKRKKTTAENAKKKTSNSQSVQKKRTKKMRNQRQRKTYYVKQTVKPRENPIYNAEMLKKNKSPTNNIQRQKKI